MNDEELRRVALGSYADRNGVHIWPEKFWTAIKDNPADPLNPFKIDMCRWVKRGDPASGVVVPIEKVRKREDYWRVIGPKYEAWKKGHEIPADGTPLSAWPGCRPEEAERFNLMRIYTVQDVAAMTDDVMDRYGMGARDKRQQAQAFLQAGDRAKLAAESEQLKRELTEARNELADAIAAIKELKAQLPIREEVPNPAPRRGRPPKAA